MQIFSNGDNQCEMSKSVFLGKYEKMIFQMFSAFFQMSAGIFSQNAEGFTADA